MVSLGAPTIQYRAPNHETCHAKCHSIYTSKLDSECELDSKSDSKLEVDSERLIVVKESALITGSIG